MSNMNGQSNGHSNGVTNGMMPGYAPLGTVFDTDKPARKRSVRPPAKEDKPSLSADDARKQIGEQVTCLREFSAQLNEFLKNTQQAISNGDFGPTTVETAGELLDELEAFKTSLNNVYDVALERNHARLPPARRKR